MFAGNYKAFSAALLLLLAATGPLICEIKYVKATGGSMAVTSKNFQGLPVAGLAPATVLQQLQQRCASVFPIFDPQNNKWRKFFAVNCKMLLKHEELAGDFGNIYSAIDKEPKLEYAFFKGTTHADQLIVIASGGFYDKHFALPYVVILNKLLGFSCVIADYRGHENSWHRADPNNLLYRMCDPNRACGIDSSQFTFGRQEGLDFYHLIAKIKQQHPMIQRVHGLGICFGSIVLSRAHNLYRRSHEQDLFDSLLLISPLPSAHDLVLNVLCDTRALTKFVSQQTFVKVSSWPFLKIARLMLKLPLIKYCLTGIVTRYLGIKSFDSLAEFKKLRIPLLCIASNDSDYIVTKQMALKVWHNIPSKQKLLLWSFGVEHLFNWHEEMTQLTKIFEQFFGHPKEVIANPETFLT